MSTDPPSRPSAAADTWRADPSVLSCRFGYELIAYHLRTKRSYRLPSLPARVQELIERGGAIDIDASRPAWPGPADEGRQVGLDELLAMLEREQLVFRAEGENEGRARRSEPAAVAQVGHSVEGPTLPGRGDVLSASLYVNTVLQRAKKVDVTIQGGQIRLALASNPDRMINGGTHALRLLDVFARPRTIQEVVRVVQRRVQEAHGWIELIESLLRLYDGGILEVVPQGLNGRVEERVVTRTLASSGPREPSQA
ncbi:MAG: hypothetical protein R3181_02895 [Rubricoccaceae bacterium]|nr:hypothetical protein [Rubricoccaceae bacterium]